MTEQKLSSYGEFYQICWRIRYLTQSVYFFYTIHTDRHSCRSYFRNTSTLLWSRFTSFRSLRTAATTTQYKCRSCSRTVCSSWLRQWAWQWRKVIYRSRWQNLNGIIFTALHAMQTRSSDENSVRPSVGLSVCLSVCLPVCHTRVLW